MTHPSEIVFVRLLIPFSAGILLFSDLPATLLNYCAGLTLFTFICLLSINLGYIYLKAYRFKIITNLIFWLFMILLGSSYAMLFRQSNTSDYFGTQNYQYLKIIIDEEPQQKGNITRFTARVHMAYRQETPIPVSGRLLVAFKTDTTQSISYKYGDELMVPANFKAIDPPNNPSEFDVRFWLAMQNIYHQSFLKPQEILKLGSNKGNPVISYALELRQKQLSVYKRLLKKEEAFAVASTLILGYRADLSTETLNAYSKTGTIHALSVSGMHVGLIYIVLNQTLFFMDRHKTLRILKILLTLCLIWFYSLLTGYCPAVLRSAIMLSVFILAKSFRKKTNSYNIIAFSAFCLLVSKPFLIWDTGFQLSFISVVGLVYVQPKISGIFRNKNKWIAKLWEVTAMSLAAQLVTFPLSIYYFHQFPIYFLLGNLFILLPVSLMMYLGLIILIFRAYFLAPIFEWTINFTNEGLRYISKLPFSSLSSLWISKTELYLLSITILLFLLAFDKHHKKLLFVFLSIFLILQCLLTNDTLTAKYQQKIIFFSLKRNYAAAFIYGDTAVLITDLKPYEKKFRFSVQPALDQHKIRQLYCIGWESSFKSAELNISAHQILFHNYRILKFDTCFKRKLITGKPGFNLLWLQLHPKFDTEMLQQQVSFKKLIHVTGDKTFCVEVKSNNYQNKGH